MFDWIGEQIQKVFVWIFTAIATAFAQAALAVSSWVMELAVGETPRYEASFLAVWYGRIFAVALPLVVMIAAAQIARSAFSLKALSGVRIALVGAVNAVIATLLAFPVIALIGAGIDSLCAKLWELGKGDVRQAISQLEALFSSFDVDSPLEAAGAAAVASKAPIAAASLFLFVLTFSILASLVLWFVLTIRTHLLYISIVALPIAMAGLSSDATKTWPRKIMTFIAALLVCKIGIVVILGMGMSAIGDITNGATSVATKISAVISLTAFNAIGCFMPSLAFKLFDFIDGEFQASQAQNAMVEPVKKAGDKAKTVVAASATGGASAAGGVLAGSGGKSSELSNAVKNAIGNSSSSSSSSQSEQPFSSSGQAVADSSPKENSDAQGKQKNNVLPSPSSVSELNDSAVVAGGGSSDGAAQMEDASRAVEVSSSSSGQSSVPGAFVDSEGKPPRTVGGPLS